MQAADSENMQGAGRSEGLLQFPRIGFRAAEHGGQNDFPGVIVIAQSCAESDLHPFATALRAMVQPRDQIP